MGNGPRFIVTVLPQQSLTRKIDYREQTVWARRFSSMTAVLLIWEEGINTLWTGDADLRLYITTVQDG